MKINIKAITKPALSLFIICLAVTSLLALTAALTKNKIAERAKFEITETRKVVLADAVSFEEVKDNAVRGKDKDGNIVGYVITVIGKGYGGDMQVMVGIDSDGKVSGVSILSHSETPGLGAKTDDPKFLSQFIGMSKTDATITAKTTVNNEIDAETGATTKSNESTVNNESTVSNESEVNKKIDTITGATISSKAVIKAVNEAINEYETIMGENNGK